MKNAIALFLVCITFSTILPAQVMDIPMENAVWYSDGYGDMGEPNEGLRIAPDSLVEINGKVYAWTKYKMFPFDNDLEIHYRSENGRTYVLPTDSLEEALIYDFNLEVGDTLLLTWPQPVKMYVQNISQITTEDGKIRNRFYLESDEYHYANWIEGIGESSWIFLFPYAIGSVSGGYNFRCFSENNERVYSTGNYLGCLVVSTEDKELPEPSFLSYPNPFRDQFYLTDEIRNVKTVRVFDNTGKLLLLEKEPGPGQPFTLDQQPKGVYLLEVSLEDGSQLARKIVKR